MEDYIIVGKQESETQAQFADRISTGLDEAFKTAIMHCLLISRNFTPDASEEEQTKAACQFAVDYVRALFRRDYKGTVSIEVKR